MNGTWWHTRDPRDCAIVQGFELSGLYLVFGGRVKGGVTIGLGGSSGLFYKTFRIVFFQWGERGDFGGVLRTLYGGDRWGGATRPHKAVLDLL